MPDESGWCGIGDARIFGRMSQLLPVIDLRLLDLPDRELMATVHGEAICRSCKPDVLAELAHRERRAIGVRLAIVSVGVRRHPFPQLLTVGDGVDASTRAVLDVIRGCWMSAPTRGR